MADPPKFLDGPTPSSPLQHTKRSREHSGIYDDGADGRRLVARGLRTTNATSNTESNGEAAWYSAISSRSFNPPAPQGSQLPTPQTHVAVNAFPFFPVAVGSPESPLAYSHPRTSGGTSGVVMPSRIQPRPNLYVGGDFQGSRSFFTTQPQTITPKASPMSSPTSVPPRPLSTPLLSPTPQGHTIFVKTESPPPILAPAHDISPSKGSPQQVVSLEVQTTGLSLSSPFVENPRPSTASAGVRFSDPYLPHLLQALSPSTSNPTQTTVLSSPAHIEERETLTGQTSSSTHLSSEERARQPGGELDRIRNRMLSVEDARKAELENRRPEYLKRLQRDDIGSSIQSVEGEPIEKDGLGIMTSPAKGRRIQLFDFQETSAESFEESLMTHGYGTYGEPRTPHRPLVATEGLSQEAMDWLAYNTPAAVPGSDHPHLGLEVEQNEKELKKRKRLEAFKGSTARAYAKLYPAEVEGLGRVLLNVPPDNVDDLSGSPAKKRSTAKKKRGGAAAAAEKKRKLTHVSGLVHTGLTEPRWLDKEIPWCLREKEREEEVKARDADRLKWIDKYLGHDTDSDSEMDSDKNDEESSSLSRGLVSENAPDSLRRGRGKAVPLQSNPNRSHFATRTDTTPAPDSGKGKSLFFPTDPADARTALMSKRSVRLLAQRKLRQNGQRSASLRGIGEGRLACACGRDDDDDGRPAVQCDDCYNWHHLECIGVHDERELGDEDDPWFCPVCTAQSEATNSASDWRNQRQPTFVPTDDRPVDTSTRSDIAFYSSSPLREWASSGSLYTPVQGQGRLHDSEFFRRSIWDDPRTGPGPSTPVTTSRGVQVFTPGSGHGEYGHVDMFDPTISPRTGYPKFGTSFTTPKNTDSSRFTGGSSFSLPWPTHSGGLFTTPTSRGRLANPGSAGYGFNYASDDPINAQFSAPFGHSARADAIYAADDTPIRRAPAKETRKLGPSLHPSSGTLIDSPLAGRGVESFAGPEGSSDVRRAPAK